MVTDDGIPFAERTRGPVSFIYADTSIYGPAWMGGVTQPSCDAYVR